MSHQYLYNRITNYSNQKNKKFMIRNIRGMNDPAFKSNKTLKQYINKKLTSYEEPEINNNNDNRGNKNVLIFNDKEKVKNRNNKNINKFIFTENSFYSKSQMHNLSHYNNSSLNNLRKIRIRNRNNYYIFKCNGSNKNSNNKSTKNIIINKNKKELNIEKNKINNNYEIILTPNSNSRKGNNKTTPINCLNKIKGIYKQKNIFLNKSYKSYNRVYTSKIKQDIKKVKEVKSPKNNDKAKLKQAIYNIINNKPLNKTYFKENSKKSRRYRDNLTENFRSENNDKFKDIFLNDKSLNESDCPEPMPYVKKYSDIINNEKENISNSGVNIINNYNNNLKDLNEPKEEKNIPLPYSKIFDRNVEIRNKNKKFIYFNE